jgi:hypothetical protein
MQWRNYVPFRARAYFAEPRDTLDAACMGDRIAIKTRKKNASKKDRGSNDLGGFHARNVVRSAPATAIQIRLQVDALVRVRIARAAYGARRERRRTLVHVLVRVLVLVQPSYHEPCDLAKHVLALLGTLGVARRLRAGGVLLRVAAVRVGRGHRCRSRDVGGLCSRDVGVSGWRSARDVALLQVGRSCPGQTSFCWVPGDHTPVVSAVPCREGAGD